VSLALRSEDGFAGAASPSSSHDRDDHRSDADAHDVARFAQRDWIEAHHQTVSAALMRCGFVPLYPQLVVASGSLKAALMLGQAIRLSRTWLRHDPGRKGWFWMSTAEWQGATGLTPREQEPARAALVEAGLWEERRTFNPSRLYFRVHLDVVARALGMSCRMLMDEAGEPPVEVWRWDEAQVAHVLDGSRMFFKPLADLTGGVMAGLMLSQLLQQQRAALRGRRVDPHGRFVVRYDRLADELLMGRKTMRCAREQLRRAGFIVEEVRGAGPAARVHVGVNLEAMMACLQPRVTGPRSGQARLPAARPTRPALPAVKPAIAGNRQSAQSASPVLPSPQMSFLDQDAAPDHGLANAASNGDQTKAGADGAFLSIAKRAATPRAVDNHGALLSVANRQGCPFVGCDGALLSSAYTDNNYKEPPPPTRAREAVAVDDFAAGRRRSSDNELEPQPALLPAGTDLVVPQGVDRQRALRALELARVPAPQQQILLDELAGHLQSRRKSIDSPLGYLSVIARKAVEGSFVPTVAAEVAQARQARAEAALREARALGGGLPAANASARVTAESKPAAELSGEAEAARARLLSLRSAISARAALGSLANAAEARGKEKS
jgi:hypothetical protein